MAKVEKEKKHQAVKSAEVKIDPKVVEKDLDQIKNHYQKHPKFSKFNLHGGK